MNLNNRGWNFLGAFICYQLIVTALYFQYVDGLEPCPLCMFQRAMVIALGGVLLINAVHNPKINSWANRICCRPLVASLLQGVMFTCSTCQKMKFRPAVLRWKPWWTCYRLLKSFKRYYRVMANAPRLVGVLLGYQCLNGCSLFSSSQPWFLGLDCLSLFNNQNHSNPLKY